MRAFLTLSPVGAETGKIELADGFANVLLTAARSERTEAFLIVWARRDFRCWIDMQVEALVPVRAMQGSRVVIAFRHTPTKRDALVI